MYLTSSLLKQTNEATLTVRLRAINSLASTVAGLARRAPFEPWPLAQPCTCAMPSAETLAPAACEPSQCQFANDVNQNSRWCRPGCTRTRPITAMIMHDHSALARREFTTMAGMHRCSSPKTHCRSYSVCTRDARKCAGE